MNAVTKFTEALGVAETGIRRVAVIGAGSMGSGIAAQFANAGVPVDLIDLPGAIDRNAAASGGIARQLKAGGFMVPQAAKLVRPGNMEDDLGRLADADWIVEAVIEDLAIKQALFRRIEALRKPGSIISSNTSTILRAALVGGMPGSFARDFVITHFFNPPRVMRLVELVGGAETSPELMERTANGLRRLLGKTVIEARDTPGFIANRIGCFWMATALLEAERLGLTVEEADAVHTVLGVPRTGVFGLMDLVGIDLIPHVWGSLMATLPADDAIQTFDLPGWSVTQALIASGRLGRKSGAGFYRRHKDGRREALDLASGEYRPEAPCDPASLVGGGRDLAALIADEGRLGQYAWSVLSNVLTYAATHAPTIAGDAGAVDAGLELGYSWRRGPFKLADAAGLGAVIARLEAEGRAVPGFLITGREGFYPGGQPLLTSGAGVAASASPSLLSGAGVMRGNSAARLRDLGDGVACLELTTRMNALEPLVFDVLEETLAGAGRDYAALVIGNDDPKAFSAGANLGHVLKLLEGGFAPFAALIQRGQQAFLGLKYSKVPVVAAAHGHMLGGGCEMALHCDAIVAHAELAAGLPEVSVGLLPGWGGCTQMLLRAPAGGPVASASAVFATIAQSKTSTSALEARNLGFLRASDGIVMNRDDLLTQAVDRARAMIPGYTPPEPALLTVAGPSGRLGLLAPLSAAEQAGQTTATDYRAGEILAWVLTGGDHGDPTRPMTEEAMMDLERQGIARMFEDAELRARTAHFMAKGKPLRN